MMACTVDVQKYILQTERCVNYDQYLPKLPSFPGVFQYATELKFIFLYNMQKSAT